MQIATPASLAKRVSGMSRELKLFLVASLTMGMAYSMFDAIFNNFLNERFDLSAFQRSFLEFPRELPGFLVVFTSALLWFLCSRRLGALALALGAIGAVLIGFLSSSYAIMVVFLFIYSTGQHLFMPVASTIGMELAHEGKVGQRLGQINAIRNAAAIMGSLIVVLGFRFLGLRFEHVFVFAAIGLGVAAVLMFNMQTNQVQSARTRLTLHKEYKLYYMLAVLYGSRKQLFMTFAPWVLVTIFKQPTALLATLMTIGGVIGIAFQPLLGWAIDKFGERVVLASEAVMLVVVCAGYGFARSFLPEGIAFLVVCACFLVDNMLMSVGMARSTYIKKIAIDPSHVQSALAAGVTIDHIFSISVALLGGLIWNRFGFQYVFLLGAGIALVNFFVALRVKVS
jgi:predicted MFS family arabinose efflux permease